MADKKKYTEPIVSTIKGNEAKAVSKELRKQDREKYLKSAEYRERKERARRIGSRILDGANFDGLMRVFGFVFGMLLLTGLISQATGTEGNPRTFAGFLEFLANGRWQIPLDWLDWSGVTLGGDWGIFNFLREFIQLNIAGFNALLWLGTMIINITIFISQFAIWLWGFA